MKAVVQAQAEHKRVKDERDRVNAKISNKVGKTWVVRKVTFDASITELAALANGVPVQMTLDLAFCGEPKTVKFLWLIGRPLENAKTIIQDVVPAFNAIATASAAPPKKQGKGTK